MSKKDPNREYAESRLNMGQDPGPGYADLSDKYRQQQESKNQNKNNTGCAATLLVIFACIGAAASLL